MIMNKKEILNFLDERFDNIEMPCFGNMNIDYVTSQLSVYVNPEGLWIILFNSVVWWPAGEGLMGMIELVGPGVSGVQGFDNDRTFIPGLIDYSFDDDRIMSVQVRGKEIDIESLNIKPQLDMQAELGFWACCALIKNYRSQLLANEQELYKFIPEGFECKLVLDEWQHPDWNCPPSQTHTFTKIAAALAEGVALEFESCPNPNTHWSKWIPK